MGRLLPLLAPAQVISWGTLYYAIAFLAEPIQADTGWRSEAIFLAFSIGLLVSALAAIPAGRMLSRFGGRRVLVTGSALAATALTVIGLSRTPAVFTAGWVLAGAAMALTQYEAAFSTLRQLVPRDFRRAAGWITVTGGLASTLFWPLTHGLAESIGWRATVLCFAALHLVPSLLLHWRLPSQRPAGGPEKPPAGADGPQAGDRPVAALLAIAFSGTAVVTATVSAHAQQLMEAVDVSTGDTLVVLAMIGPMQVAGRLFELALARRISSSAAALAATALLVLSVLLLGYAGTGVGVLVLFTVAYGFANGGLTVVRGGLPAELMPHADYARTLGGIAAPALVARAAAPALAAWLMGALGARAIPLFLAIAAVFAFAAVAGAVVLVARRSRNRPAGGSVASEDYA